MGFISDLTDSIEGLGETAVKVTEGLQKYRTATKGPTNPRYTQDQLEYEIYRRQQDRGTMPSGPDINFAGLGGGMTADNQGTMLALAGLGLIGLAVYVS